MEPIEAELDCKVQKASHLLITSIGIIQKEPPGRPQRAPEDEVTKGFHPFRAASNPGLKWQKNRGHLLDRG